MNNHHKQLAQGRWVQMSFIDQMANIGSEVERALNWLEKKNVKYCELAFDRMLELIDLTIADSKNISKLKELCRVREALVDYFYGDNQFLSTPLLWRNYFICFAYASRKNY